MINKNQVYKAFYETIASGESDLHYIKGALDVSKKLLIMVEQSNHSVIETTEANSDKKHIPELFG